MQENGKKIWDHSLCFSPELFSFYVCIIYEIQNILPNNLQKNIEKGCSFI